MIFVFAIGHKIQLDSVMNFIIKIQTKCCWWNLEGFAEAFVSQHPGQDSDGKLFIFYFVYSHSTDPTFTYLFMCHSKDNFNWIKRRQKRQMIFFQTSLKWNCLSQHLKATIEMLSVLGFYLSREFYFPTINIQIFCILSQTISIRGLHKRNCCCKTRLKTQGRSFVSG